MNFPCFLYMALFFCEINIKELPADGSRLPSSAASLLYNHSHHNFRGLGRGEAGKPGMSLLSRFKFSGAGFGG